MDNARFPVGRVVGFGAIRAVANVIHGDLVAVNISPAFLRDIRLPVTIAVRLDS